MRYALIPIVLLCAVLTAGARAAESTPFLTIPAFEVVEDSELIARRFPVGMVVHGETTGLTPFYAYTVWAVIFNDPSAPDPDSVIWSGAGFVADGDGEAKFTTVLLEHFSPGEVRFGPGLTDAENAEIHFVVRCHGPAAFHDRELLKQQLTTFAGGCAMFGCEDAQVAIIGD